LQGFVHRGDRLRLALAAKSARDALIKADIAKYKAAQ
jgi:hypothetical protein